MLVSGKCRVRVDAGCAVAGALVVALLALGVLVAVGPGGRLCRANMVGIRASGNRTRK